MVEHEESDRIDIPRLTSILCFSTFSFLTELDAGNADALAAVFRSRAPWCNFEPTLPFTALDDQPAMIEALTIARGTGNSPELGVVDFSSLTNLRSLHIEERCFLYACQLLAHNLQFLKSIRVDEYCFFGLSDVEVDSILSIKNCSQLESIHIGSACFRQYFELALESG